MIYSQFNYGHIVTPEVNLFPIDEGTGIVEVSLRVRSYSCEDFIKELNSALNSQLNNDYTVSLDRITHKITISSSDVFSIPRTSYPNFDLTLYTLTGFGSGPDLTGSSSYTASNITGFIFKPQFELQSFRDFNDFQRAANASINESASGRVEVIKFGNVKIMQCNITLQTNITTISSCEKSPIRPDPHGVDNLRLFMEYAITKSPLEFVRDENNPNSFVKCILESTPSSSEGTGFELIQLYSRGLVGYFETGVISFREIL